MTERRCDRCSYFQVITAYTIGECRQFSPETGGEFEQKWPIVYVDDWCGQFSPYQIEKSTTLWQRIKRKVMKP